MKARITANQLYEIMGQVLLRQIPSAGEYEVEVDPIWPDKIKRILIDEEISQEDLEKFDVDPIEEEKKCLEENCRICQPPQKIEELKEIRWATDSPLYRGSEKVENPQFGTIEKLADKINELVKAHNRHLNKQ